MSDTLSTTAVLEAPPPPEVGEAIQPEARIADAAEGAPVADEPRPETPDAPAAPAPADDNFEWDKDIDPAIVYADFGKHLAAAPGRDIFRNPGRGGGLLVAYDDPRELPQRVTKGAELAPLLVDRVRVRVMDRGVVVGRSVPSSDRSVMLGTEAFLDKFRMLDRVVTSPQYLPDFRLTVPGYNNGGRGHRIFYAGEPARVTRTRKTISRFLDVMDFAGPADRANAVAAALTVLLRNHFPGEQPLLCVTANKSHAGKDTIIAFAAGNTRISSISYQRADWALERAFVGAMRTSSDTGVVVIDNARLNGREEFIASAFVERFVTDREPTLFSTGTGAPTRRTNDIVVAISTNDGLLSNDLMNRSLPIHLEVRGNIEDRRSPIGNPRLDFLPKHAENIAAELRGMIENWKDADMPLASNVKHPFTCWARTVGGILAANGVEGFLENYALRKVSQDPLRVALGILGAANPGAVHRDETVHGNTAPGTDKTAAKWAKLAIDVGVAKTLLDPGDLDTEAGRIRGIGAVLTRHDGEVITARTDNEVIRLRVRRARRRFTPGAEPEVRYWYEVLERTSIPADEEPAEESKREAAPSEIGGAA